MEKIDILLEIAKETGLCGKKELTTAGLAKRLKVSQQTISNSLRMLESEGLIERDSGYSGTVLSFTDRGRETLQEYLNRLQSLFRPLDSLGGSVFSGLGEGSYYTGLEGYRKQFIKKLGIMPFPGTLNLKVDAEQRKRFLLGKAPCMIDGFSAHGRTFGPIGAYIVHVGSTKAAIIIPHRSHYRDDSVELISADGLREKFNLKDGSGVEIRW